MATVLQLPQQMPTNLLSSRASHLQLLQEKAALLRIDSVRATTEAGSGHPTSCASAAEIVSTLFFSVMHFDPRSPNSDANDIFVLSKGHAAPLLYAAWAEAGAFPERSCSRFAESILISRDTLRRVCRS
jgi:transketolase N-terminal domain/subunit